MLLPIIANGVHQPERHQHKTRGVFFFVVFFSFLFFLFFGLVLVGHKTSQSKVSFDFMLDLFVLCCFLSLTLCDIDACMFVRLKKKNVGIRLFCDVFSKTVQPDDKFCQNIPVWIFDMTLHFSCLPDVSSFPNLNGCDFLDYLQSLHVLCYQNHLFNLCFIYRMGVTRPTKGFFSSS